MSTEIARYASADVTAATNAQAPGAPLARMNMEIKSKTMGTECHFVKYSITGPLLSACGDCPGRALSAASTPARQALRMSRNSEEKPWWWAGDSPQTGKRQVVGWALLAVVGIIPNSAASPVDVRVSGVAGSGTRSPGPPRPVGQHTAGLRRGTPALPPARATRPFVLAAVGAKRGTSTGGARSRSGRACRRAPGRPPRRAMAARGDRGCSACGHVLGSGLSTCEDRSVH